MLHKTRGLVWIAFGNEFLGMALHSARSAMKHSPNIGRALITNMPLDRVTFSGESLFQEIIVVSADNSEAFKWKLSVDKYCNWDHVLFLDADIEVRRDVYPVFEALNHYPLALCPRGNPCNKKGSLWGGDLSNCGLREFNSGVIGFDNSDPRVPDFFSRLRVNYAARNEKVDQPSFMVTIYEDPSLPVAPLSVEWNATNRWSEARSFIRRYPSKLGLYHYRDPHRYFDVESGIKETVTGISVQFQSHASRYKDEFDTWRSQFLQECRGFIRNYLARFVERWRSRAV